MRGGKRRCPQKKKSEQKARTHPPSKNDYGPEGGGKGVDIGDQRKEISKRA